MDNVDAQVLKKAEEWRAAGHRAVLGTVVRTWGSAPRPVGAHVLVRDDGLVVGSVSGGCIEDDLVDKVRSGKVAADRPERVRYGITATRHSSSVCPAAGTIELILEPVHEGSKLGELLERVGAGRHTLRRLDLKTGEVTLRDGSGTDVLACDDEQLITAHGPRLPAARHRRRPADPLRRADGLGPRLPGDDLRSARGVRRRLLCPGTELVRTMPTTPWSASGPTATRRSSP